MTNLGDWQAFFYIVGPTAGALIGLNFVVLSFVSELPEAPEWSLSGSAFSSPTIVHFEVVLFLAAVVSAPWPGIGVPSLIWGIVGIVGATYVGWIGRRFRNLKSYQPNWEDRTFHLVLPFAAYALMVFSAWEAHVNVDTSLFSVGAAAMVLLYVGIHNAWDNVTYIVTHRRRTRAPS